MNSGEELELFRRYLVPRDTKLLAKLALSCTTNSLGGSLKVGTSFAGDPKRVGAASVGPHGYRIESTTALADA